MSARSLCNLRQSKSANYCAVHVLLEELTSHRLHCRQKLPVNVQQTKQTKSNKLKRVRILINFAADDDLTKSHKFMCNKKKTTNSII